MRWRPRHCIIDGAPIARARLGMLGYELGQRHTAGAVLGDQASEDHGLLDRAAEALAQVGRSPPSVHRGGERLDAVGLIAGSAGPDLGRLERLIAELPGVRVAIGPAADGIDGFRASHLAATATQRLMVRVAAEVRVATYDAVEIVALVTADESRAAEFVTRTLGELESAQLCAARDHAHVRRLQSNTSRTAEALFTHRNTVLHALNRAEQLLPRPLQENSLAVAVALEVVHWRGE